MLDFKKVLAAKPKEHKSSTLESLMTPWGDVLDVDHVLQEHPTPQFARESFEVLNGTWRCAFVENGYEVGCDLLDVVANAVAPTEIDTAITVPFSPEAPLSGVGRQLLPGELLWYRRDLDSSTLESITWADNGEARVILHFQAVDYACAVWVNGNLAGKHLGGYTSFSFDITDLLCPGSNELLVCVADPSEQGAHLRGKQRIDRGDIWYTAQSGIWQTVWIESVPDVHIEHAAIEPELDSGILAVGLKIVGLGKHQTADVTLEVFDDIEGAEPIDIATCHADATCAVALKLENVEAWSPENPKLYGLKLSIGDDVVRSYCAFRKVELAAGDNRNPHLLLNGKRLFIKGVLDQGYWPDGLMTAPSDDALAFDIEVMRESGFNLMRKHIKVESERWYYHCDRLGMLVLQDMVSGGSQDYDTWAISYKPTLFKASWTRFDDEKPSHWKALGSQDESYRETWTSACEETIRQLSNHPCIIGWSLFNEGWGQFCAKQACALARSIDSTRLIDSVSGWYDQGVGDFFSVHNYFRDHKAWRDRKGRRAFFISEFGGFTFHVEGHSSLPEAYGYESFESIEEWRQAVRSQLAIMDELESSGLAGYVYTQVSDIEEETNGILTYDRRINKFDC